MKKLWLAKITSKIPQAYFFVPVARNAIGISCMLFMILVRKLVKKNDR